jgi:hypothetical protein
MTMIMPVPDQIALAFVSGCDDWVWLSLNRRSRQLLVTCGYERSVFFLVYDRGNRVDVCKGVLIDAIHHCVAMLYWLYK